MVEHYERDERNDRNDRNERNDRNDPSRRTEQNLRGGETYFKELEELQKVISSRSSDSRSPASLR
jgi:hypothetical protein